MKIIVGERIRGLMQEHGLSQVALAEKIDVKQNTVSAWVLGRKEPCIENLWRLANYFDVSIDYLVGRTGD